MIFRLPDEISQTQYWDDRHFTRCKHWKKSQYWCLYICMHTRIYSESLEFSSICVWVTWPDEFVQSFLWQLMAAMFEIQFCCPRLPVLSSQKPGGWELAENQYLCLQGSDSKSETKYQLTLHFKLRLYFMLDFMGHFHAKSDRYLNISEKIL